MIFYILFLNHHTYSSRLIPPYPLIMRTKMA